jgi:hypothetical protein
MNPIRPRFQGYLVVPEEHARQLQKQWGPLRQLSAKLNGFQADWGILPERQQLWPALGEGGAAVLRVLPKNEIAYADPSKRSELGMIDAGMKADLEAKSVPVVLVQPDEQWCGQIPGMEKLGAKPHGLPALEALSYAPRLNVQA